MLFSSVAFHDILIENRSCHPIDVQAAVENKVEVGESKDLAGLAAALKAAMATSEKLPESSHALPPFAPYQVSLLSLNSLRYVNLMPPANFNSHL